MPTTLAMICAVLVWAVPYIVCKINNKLHEIGDPLWKLTEQDPSDNNPGT